MKTVRFGRNYWLLSCGFGLVVFFLISFMSGNDSWEPIAEILLWPGAAIAAKTGFGAHDIQGFFLYTLGNAAFYCVIFLVLLRFFGVGAKSSSPR
jgi:hypothetical protein